MSGTVAALITEAAETVTAMRVLLQAWEPDVRCAECGERYRERPCGLTHAKIAALVFP